MNFQCLESALKPAVLTSFLRAVTSSAANISPTIDSIKFKRCQRSVPTIIQDTDDGRVPVNSEVFYPVLDVQYFRCTGLHTPCHMPVNNNYASMLQGSPAHYR